MRKFFLIVLFGVCFATPILANNGTLLSAFPSSSDFADEPVHYLNLPVFLTALSDSDADFGEQQKMAIKNLKVLWKASFPSSELDIKSIFESEGSVTFAKLAKESGIPASVIMRQLLALAGTSEGGNPRIEAMVLRLRNELLRSVSLDGWNATFERTLKNYGVGRVKEQLYLTAPELLVFDQPEKLIKLKQKGNALGLPIQILQPVLTSEGPISGALLSGRLDAALKNQRLGVVDGVNVLGGSAVTMTGATEKIAKEALTFCTANNLVFSQTTHSNFTVNDKTAPPTAAKAIEASGGGRNCTECFAGLAGSKTGPAPNSCLVNVWKIATRPNVLPRQGLE